MQGQTTGTGPTAVYNYSIGEGEIPLWIHISATATVTAQISMDGTNWVDLTNGQYTESTMKIIELPGNNPSPPQLRLNISANSGTVTYRLG